VLLDLIRRTWQRLVGRRPKVVRVIREVPSATAVPARLAPADVVLVVAGASRKWAVLGCPCRCGELLWLNLMRSARPRWEAGVKNGKLTLSPSVWATTSCSSHFWVKNGQIQWV